MIIAIGDVHGQFDDLYHKLKTHDVSDVTYVQVGDFGLGFDAPIVEYDALSRINSFLKTKNSRLLVIRGNHDNPSFWTPDGGFELSNIHFIPDHSVIYIDDKVCFFAGGAPSIDRKKRIQGVSLWKNEDYRYNDRWDVYRSYDLTKGPRHIFPIQFDLNEINLKKLDISVVFTHDIYHPISPFTAGNDLVWSFKRNDVSLGEYLDESQRQLSKLYEQIVKVSLPDVSWYHGHYHQDGVTRNEPHDGVDITVFSLGVMSFREVGVPKNE